MITSNICEFCFGRINFFFINLGLEMVIGGISFLVAFEADPVEKNRRPLYEVAPPPFRFSLQALSLACQGGVSARCHSDTSCPLLGAISRGS